MESFGNVDKILNFIGLYLLVNDIWFFFINKCNMKVY